MKVINIIEEGRFGGPHRRILEVAKVLRESYEIDTIVVLPNEDSSLFCKLLNEAKIKFIRVNLDRISRSKNGLLYFSLSFIPQLIRLHRLIKSNGDCIVHINGAHQMKSLLATLFTEAKTVWHLNDTHTPAVVRLLFQNLFSRRADSFIAASERTKKYYFPAKLKNGFISIVQATVDCNYFSPKHTEQNNRHKKNIVMVANVNPMKGVEVLVRVAQRLNKLDPEGFNFIVIGAILDSQKTYFKELNEYMTQWNITNVEFVGLQSDVRSFLQSADYYLCSSNFEASPISIWEAMSMRLPVVSTDVGDVRTVLESNECGLVADVGDVEGLAQHLLELKKDPTMASAMAIKARQVAIDNFDISICAKRHAMHYAKLITQVD